MLYTHLLFQSETFSTRWVKNLVDAFTYWWFHLCYKYWDTCNEIAHPCEKSFQRVMTGIKNILAIATKDSWSLSTLICYFQSELFSSKMRKRIWWMRSSTGSFIPATNFGTATKAFAHYIHLLLSEWNILLKIKKRIWWLCSSTDSFISATSIGTLVMKLHTFVKKIFEGLWLELKLFWQLQHFLRFQFCYTEWRHLCYTACRQ